MFLSALVYAWLFNFMANEQQSIILYICVMFQSDSKYEKYIKHLCQR